MQTTHYLNTILTLIWLTNDINLDEGLKISMLKFWGLLKLAELYVLLKVALFIFL